MPICIIAVETYTENEKGEYKMQICTLENTFTEYPEIVCPETAAKMLGIWMNSIYNMLKTGELKSIRIGRLHKIPKLYLINYINKTK